MRAVNRQSARDIADYATTQTVAGKPERTVYLRTWQLRRFAAEYPGSIRAARTEDLARHLTGHGWAPATIYSVRATFISFYDYLVVAGRIRKNPARALPATKRPRREPKPAPEEVVQRPASSARMQLMIDLAARQGLRRAEIAVVHSRDLIGDGRGWALIVHGKGAKERTVPLHDDIAARIRANGPGWLFPSPYGGHLSVTYVGRIISEELQGWSAHDLRRRFATQINLATGDLVSIMKLLGHASLATTQLYAGTNSEKLRAAVRHAA